MPGDSKELLELMRAFVSRNVSVTEFADRYQLLWRHLCDTGSMEKLHPCLQRAIDVVFTAIDDAESPLHGRSLSSEQDKLRHDISIVLSVIDTG
jgi:hypothetical protein